MSTTLVIYNPVCGDSTAKKLFTEHVIPLLHKSGKIIPPDNIIETTHLGHAGEVVLDLLRTQPGEQLSIILGSGDGTLHEIVSAIQHSTTVTWGKTDITFALVPCGTANALYSSLFPPTSTTGEGDPQLTYKLQSVQSFLSSKPTEKPLSLAVTSTYPASQSNAKETIKNIPIATSTSVVVASTALHASILHDSEALRASIPTMERFKVAAQQNITHWYSAKVKLLPPPGIDNDVLLYDPGKNEFVKKGSDVELEGPFAYFLSTVNVDRLEPAFRITPLFTSLVPHRQSLDIVIVRPLRDPSISGISEEAKGNFAAKSVQVLAQGAYQDGAHIRMRYNEDGSIDTTSDEGSTVVEYYRCGGWEWVPESTDIQAHLVCIDGEILHIPKQGKASCSISETASNVHFSVFI
ncbi:ATP-NAD kinase-like domain-containing protein [Abortiporus biennis]|nr:ATP-NAD kinase-like domain-containing protein [Abortiporus biennis]